MGHLYRLASLLGLTPLWSGQIPTATGGYHVLGRRVICGTCGARDRRTMGGELIIPVIMCGGAGTRLWPVSRESMPKQFVPLIDERSTFNRFWAELPTQIYSIDRLSLLIPIFVLLPPSSCASATLKPTWCWSRRAAIPPWLSLSRRSWRAGGGRSACVLVLAADHVVRNAEALDNACREAAKAAAAGLLSRSASRRPIPRPATATYVQERSSMAARHFPSTLLSKNRIPRRPASTLRSVFSGTAAISCFAPM